MLAQIGLELDVPVYNGASPKASPASTVNRSITLTIPTRPSPTSPSLWRRDFLLKDFGALLRERQNMPPPARTRENFRKARRSIVITGASVQVPPDIDGDAIPFQIGLPDTEELLSGVRQTLAELNRDSHIVVSLDPMAMQQARKPSPDSPKKKRFAHSACVCSLAEKAMPVCWRICSKRNEMHCVVKDCWKRCAATLHFPISPDSSV